MDVRYKYNVRCYGKCGTDIAYGAMGNAVNISYGAMESAVLTSRMVLRSDDAPAPDPLLDPRALLYLPTRCPLLT
eukprot:1696538-Rhodomonas_salina.1